MSMILIVGFLATIFTSLSLLPQLIKLVKEKKPSDISMGMLICLFIGLLFWIWYGIMLNNTVLVVANIVSLVFNAVVVCINLYYRKNADAEFSSLQKYPHLRKSAIDFKHSNDN